MFLAQKVVSFDCSAIISDLITLLFLIHVKAGFSC